jgi:hypothetical protein
MTSGVVRNPQVSDEVLMRRTAFLTLLSAVLIHLAIAQAPQRGHGGGQGGGIATMVLTTAAWSDGGKIPVKYTQAGEQFSPALSWGGVPEGTLSFVLLFHDLDSAAGKGKETP